MRKTATLILLSTFIGSIAGQKNNESTFFNKHLRPETPTVSQFLRYDEMPVSEYTGIPDISIPIYNIDVDGLRIPIKLSYHAGGIKVNQEASWVGLGWDLTMGSIVQIINDEDDLNLPHLDNRNRQRLLPDYPDSTQCLSRYLNAPSVPIYEPQRKHIVKVATDFYVPINGVYVREGLLFDDYGYFYDCKDSEPDIFKVNLPTGEWLNFIIDWKTNQYVVLNKKGYIINRSNNENTWSVTNPYGVKYYFSTYFASYNAIGGGFDGLMHSWRKATQIWLLNRITTCNGKDILFDYEVTQPITWGDISNQVNNSSYSKQASEMKYHELDKNIYGCNHNYQAIFFPHSIQEAYSSSSFEGIFAVGNYTYEPLFFLKKITFPKGHIDFTNSPRSDKNNGKKLDKIVVSNNVDDSINTVDFNYVYFLKTSGTGRLKLISIKNNTEQYRFKYDETPLPSINSYSQDCWGYYNGHPNTSLIPNPTRYKLPDWVYKPDNNNNMSANLSFTKAGILTEITFPTGGKVEYEYESNTFDNYPVRVPDYDEIASADNDEITKGHGLRVKNIIFKDITGNVIKQEHYQYEGGKAILPKTFFRNRPYNHLVVNNCNLTHSGGFMEEISTNGHTIFNPLSSFDGIGYDSVTKKIITNNANDSSRIVTNYSNHPDITFLECIAQDALVPIPAFKNKGYPQNGVIMQKKIYDSNNILVKSENYSYDNILSPTFYGARTSFFSYYYDILYYNEKVTPDKTNMNTVSFYPIFDFETLLTSKTTKDYFNGQAVRSSEGYSYDDLNRLTKTTFQTENPSKKRITTYTYPRSNQYEEPSLISRNFINEPVVIDVYNSENKSILNIWKYYANENAGGFYDLIRLKFIERRFGINSPAVDKTSYERYDWHNNPIQIRSIDNVPISYVWSYKSAYPILEIKNATYEEAENAANNNQKFLFEIFDGRYPPLPANQLYPSDEEIWQLGETLRSNLPNAEVTTFTYKPLVGVTSITDLRGIKTSFNYDNFGRLQNTKNHSDEIFESYDYRYVTTQPVITSHSVYGNKISITYSGGSSLITAATISYNLIGSSVNGSNTSSCIGTASITVPSSNANYRITLKLHNNADLQFETSINVFVP